MILDRSDIMRDLLFMNRVMDHLMQGGLGQSSLRRLAEAAGPSAPILSETDDAYTVRFTAPGLRPDDIEVTLRGQVLTLRAATRSDAPEGSASGVRSSRAFHQTLRLPVAVEADRAE